jgi:hypothetical protein
MPSQDGLGLDQDGHGRPGTDSTGSWATLTNDSQALLSEIDGLSALGDSHPPVPLRSVARGGLRTPDRRDHQPYRLPHLSFSLSKDACAFGLDDAF